MIDRRTLIKAAGTAFVASRLGTAAARAEANDPLSYASAWPYQITTASLPAALVAGLAFIIITRLLVIRADKGGYEA